MGYRCSDNSSLEVLTPNHFLKPNVETSLFLRDARELLPPSNVRKTLAKSLEIREKILLKFKRLWYEEYLLSLKESYRNLCDFNFANKVKEGDIVLVKNPAKSRQHRVLGRVIELYPGSDGKVRNVKLLRGDADWEKKGGLKPELHSLQHLFPVELSITHPHTSHLPQSPELKTLCGREVEPAQADAQLHQEPAEIQDADAQLHLQQDYGADNVDEDADAQLHLEQDYGTDNLNEEFGEDGGPGPEVEDETEALNEPETSPLPLLALAPQPLLDETQDTPPSQPLLSRRARRIVPSK